MYWYRGRIQCDALKSEKSSFCSKSLGTSVSDHDMSISYYSVYVFHNYRSILFLYLKYDSTKKIMEKADRNQQQQSTWTNDRIIILWYIVFVFIYLPFYLSSINIYSLYFKLCYYSLYTFTFSLLNYILFWHKPKIF